MTCSGGIGKASALHLAGLGCNIAVHYHAAENIANALVIELSSLGVKAAAFQADLSTYEAVRKLHEAVVESLGHPDILFNNAGVTNSKIGPAGDIQSVSPEEFEATWRTNTGTHYLVYVLIIKSRILTDSIPVHTAYSALPP